MYQSIMLTVLIILTTATLYLHFYKTKKQIEYRNDERWQSIQNKVSQVTSRYNDVLILIIAVLMTCSLFINLNFDVNFNRVLLYGFLALSMRNIVELACLYLYNSKM